MYYGKMVKMYIFDKTTQKQVQKLETYAFNLHWLALQIHWRGTMNILLFNVLFQISN